MMETKLCPICGAEMRLEKKAPRDEQWGPSWYCSNSACSHREWGGGSGPTRVDPHQTPDWKVQEYEARKSLQAVEISDNLWLGDLIDAWKLRDQGTGQPFDAILSVSNNTYTPPPDVEFVHIPLTEYGSKPAKRLKRLKGFRDAVAQVKTWLGEGKKVFVHCTAGFNRSAAVVMAILMEQGLTYQEALETMRSKRPNAWPHGEISLALRTYMGEGEEDKESSAMGSGNFLPLQPTGKRAVDEAAEFVSQTDWEKPFDENYYRIRESTAPIEEQDIGLEFFQTENEDSNRFVSADILIDQAMGGERIAAKKKDPKKQLKLFEKGEEKEEEELVAPRLSIKPPTEMHYELLSKRGLKLPAPEVYNNEIYQAVYQRAPLIPLDPKDPKTIDRCLEFLKTTKGVSTSVTAPGKKGEYFRVPTVFGSKRVDHVMYASWFAMFSPNMAVEAEETMFVLWQAGKSSTDPQQSGIMANKPRIVDWLKFLKWAGFPRFRNLNKVLEGFDTSDESYQRRMTALSRQHGWQLKVSSFFLALMGDTRSPTLDMHALGYLIESGKLELPEDREWTPLAELAQMSNELRRLSKESTRSEYDPTFWTQGTDTATYRDLKIKYDEKVATNKLTLGALTALVRVGAEPPKTEAGRKAEEERVKEYMRRQMEGWDRNTDTFWSWYASNPFFKTHEPMRDAIHTVFFQSLFPELFTPEQLVNRDELFQRWTDPELVEDRERRMRYRNYLENLQKMRVIQPRKEPLVTQETPGAKFDWGTGEWVMKKPRKKPVGEEEQELAAVSQLRNRRLARKQRMLEWKVA